MKLKFAIVGVALLAAPLSALAQIADCACKDFDKLQQELSNAITLRELA